MILELFRWWYTTGLNQIATNIQNWPKTISRHFSVSLLTKNMFAPWRRIISYGGRSIQSQFKALLDNIVSRFVGFTSRLLVLATAFICIIFSEIAAIVVVIIWPLMPLVIIYCLIRGITG